MWLQTAQVDEVTWSVYPPGAQSVKVQLYALRDFWHEYNSIPVGM